MTKSEPLRVRVNIDGGARGNPGPAGAGVIVCSRDDGAVLYRAGVFLGSTTNNVAEYSALLVGLKAAAKLGASDVEVISDSQLLVMQMTGKYRVKNQALQVLHEQANLLAESFRKLTVTHVRREDNSEADLLVNRAINLKRNIEDAAK